MADLTSTRVSGAVANPQTIIASGLQESEIYAIKGTEEIATGNLTINSLIHLTPLPWNAKIHSIRIFNDDLDSNGAPALVVSFGVSKQTPDGTVSVVSAGVYGASLTTLQSANTTGVEVAFNARDIANVNKRVFEDAGLTAVPSDGSLAVLLMKVTTAAATAAAGTISYIINYSL